MSEQDGQLINALASSTELPIFETELVRNLIDYRWISFAKRTQTIGFIFHILYIMTMTFYIKSAYLSQNFGYSHLENKLLYVLGVMLLYPLIYEGAYIVKAGLGRVINNFTDISHIFGGYLSIYLQLTQKGSCFATWLLALLIYATLFKLFSYFRVVRSFSVVTTMIRTCMYDLRIFLAYYLILLIFFSSTMTVLSGNPQAEYAKLKP